MLEDFARQWRKKRTTRVGIDGQHVLPHVSDKARALLFQDVPPDALTRHGLSFPLSPYFKSLMTAYEEY